MTKGVNDLRQRVQLGDRIRFSAVLLRRMYEEPDHPFELVAVLHELDGTKLLVLKRTKDDAR